MKYFEYGKDNKELVVILHGGGVSYQGAEPLHPHRPAETGTPRKREPPAHRNGVRAQQSKDMGAVLALLPQTKEFITDDGLSGVLTLKLDTVNVEVAGYGSSTKTLTPTTPPPRTIPC